MNMLRKIAFVLVMVGAIVWGVLGIFNINLVAALFGYATILSRIVYALVGISAIILMATPNDEGCYCDCNERTY